MKKENEKEKNESKRGRERETRNSLTFSSCKAFKSNACCVVKQILKGTTYHRLCLLVLGGLGREGERGREGGREGEGEGGSEGEGGRE